MLEGKKNPPLYFYKGISKSCIKTELIKAILKPLMHNFIKNKLKEWGRGGLETKEILDISITSETKGVTRTCDHTDRSKSPP